MDGGGGVREGLMRKEVMVRKRRFAVDIVS
jgi:hypothetical protein